jgi:O-acetyl-ADP-ribose deacetylase (regulator of RNase III)
MVVNCIERDLFESTAQVIAHQVNCQGVMGGGVALQIRERWPEAYNRYHYLCEKSGSELLGGIQFFDLGIGRSLVHLFGQDGLGKGRQTNYEALYTALEYLRGWMEATWVGQKTVAFPYKLGCGLAGGSWEIVEAMVRTVFDGFEGVVEIYRLPGSI